MRTSELLLIKNAIDDYANKHINTLQSKDGVNFDAAFTCPPLSLKTQAELNQLSPDTYKKSLVGLETMYQNPGLNIAVGERESGKTSIALKISKNLLNDSKGELRIPIIIDFATIKSYDSLDRGIRRIFYGP